ncbi:hypothetical protein EV286_10656 [Rhizobium sp. BK251]|nr:hypothetical protein EV286_10656 [Rhizobium sp. BK251]
MLIAAPATLPRVTVSTSMNNSFGFIVSLVAEPLVRFAVCLMVRCMKTTNFAAPIR